MSRCDGVVCFPRSSRHRYFNGVSCREASKSGGPRGLFPPRDTHLLLPDGSGRRFDVIAVRASQWGPHFVINPTWPNSSDQMMLAQGSLAKHGGLAAVCRVLLFAGAGNGRHACSRFHRRRNGAATLVLSIMSFRVRIWLESGCYRGRGWCAYGPAEVCDSTSVTWANWHLAVVLRACSRAVASSSFSFLARITSHHLEHALAPGLPLGRD